MDIFLNRLNHIAGQGSSSTAKSLKKDLIDDKKEESLHKEEFLEKGLFEHEGLQAAAEDDPAAKRRKKLEGKFSEATGAAAASGEEAKPDEILLNLNKKEAEHRAQIRLQQHGTIDTSVLNEVKEFFKKESFAAEEDHVFLSKQKKETGQSPELQRLIKEKEKDQDVAKFFSQPRIIVEEEARGGSRAAAAANTKSSEEQQEAAHDKRTQDSIKEATIKYLGVFSDAMVQQTQQTKEKTRILRETLLSDGMSPRKLHEFEQTVRRTVRQDVRKQLKDSFIKLALEFDKKELTLETIRNSDEMNAIAKMAGLRGVFGAGQTTPQDVKKEGKEELQAFLAAELDNVLMESKIRGDSVQELIKAFDRFNDITNIAGFDKGAYAKTIQKKINDWGLADFKAPEKFGLIDTNPRPSNQGQGGGGGHSRQQDRTIPQQDALEDEIRNLCLQRCVRLDLRSAIDLRFKLNSLKKKLGNQELFQTLQIEGEALAKLRLYDMFKEALEEKASMSNLTSSAFHITQKKMKLALKGLKNLGCPLPKKDMIAIQTEVNGTMFSIIKEEYAKVRAAGEAAPKDVSLSRRNKELRKLLERLKKESNIKESIETAQTTVVSRQATIIEAA